MEFVTEIEYPDIVVFFFVSSEIRSKLVVPDVWNPVPVIATAIFVLCLPEVGLMPVTCGAAALTVMVFVAELVPPALVTVRVTV